MRILALTPYPPGPPKFGGQRRMHGLITALAAKHQVSLVTRVDESEESRAGVLEAGNYCAEVVPVVDPLLKLDGSQKRLFQLRSLISRHSYEHRLHTGSSFQRALDELLAKNTYDIINCEFSFMCGFDFRRTRGGRNARLVLDAHNVEHDILRRTAKASKFGRQIFHYLNYPKLRFEEIRTWRSFDGCAFTSARDAELARADAPSIQAEVVPNGVDGDHFQLHASDAVEPNTILFFGAINYWPNTDAVVYFVREVMPLVLRLNPNAKLRIVGGGAPAAVTAMQSSSVDVVGFVDDLRSEIARAAVVVVPLRLGGGTRLKIIEAMSMSKAIVSTAIGAEGLEIQHERDILIADSPQNMAAQLDRVLRDPALAARLGAGARRTTDEGYSWKASAQRLSAFYSTLINGS